MDNKTNEQESKQAVQLVTGDFSPFQAAKVLGALIDQKINYHKIEGIQQWEKDHSVDQKPMLARIKELEREKSKALEFIEEAKSEGKRLRMDGSIFLKMMD